MARRKRNRNQEKLKNIIILLVVVLLILIILISAVNLLDKNIENDINNESSINIAIKEQEIEKSKNEDELNKLKEMTERNRIEYYVSKFIKNVEEGNYEETYKVLNRDFKKNYFSTIQDFEEYSKKTFTKMVDVQYTNFERNGDIYVSWLTITDAINGDKNSGKEMNFVVKENDFNDFELAFSVN